MDTRRARIIVGCMVITFALLRVWLHMSPNSDFNLAGYNIHHLFTGFLLVVAGGIPIAVFPGRSRVLDAAAAMFGAGLAMVLDEWVYLIVTDGSNASYLLPVSLKGGMLMVTLAALYVLVLFFVTRGKR